MIETQISLFKRIIDKGGLLGTMASHYMHHPQKADEFLKECFEQAHNKSLWDFWGTELVLDLIGYRVKFLRSEFQRLHQYIPASISAFYFRS